jgi:hypothetical protein
MKEKEWRNEGKKGPVFASTFYGIADADSVGLATAGEYLRRKYGAFSQCMF